MLPLRSVFLHSSWRSGGTYIWSKFRTPAITYCYYEPLYEALRSASPASVLREQSADALHHPELTPYKLEYLPLLTQAGLDNFPVRYSYGDYLLQPGEPAAELEAYFDRLISFATERARVPVFGMVRSPLRLGWFKARFPGAHIAVRRNVRHQWFSYLHQATNGNTYFLERGPILLGRNLDHPALAGLRKLIGFPDLGRGPESESSYQLLALSLSVPQHYAIFSAVHKLAALEAERHADFVIDLDEMSLGRGHAARTERKLRAETGLKIDFSDCRIPRYDALVEQSAAFYDNLDRLVAAALANPARKSRRQAADRLERTPAPGPAQPPADMAASVGP